VTKDTLSGVPIAKRIGNIDKIKKEKDFFEKPGVKSPVFFIPLLK